MSNVITFREPQGATKITKAQYDANFGEKVTSVAHGRAVGELVYFNGTTWALATNAAAASLAQGFVHSVPDANTFYVVLTDGAILTKTAHGLGSAGTTVYCGTGGAMTATAPAGFRQAVGVVNDANTIRFRVQFPHEVV